MAADMFPALILQTPVAGFTGYLPSVINSDSFQLSKKKKKVWTEEKKTLFFPEQRLDLLLWDGLFAPQFPWDSLLPSHPPLRQAFSLCVAHCLAELNIHGGVHAGTYISLIVRKRPPVCHSDTHECQTQ